ncbi:hypothetical protein E2C01_044167 [Portunus trituberculatus]|uniref:Uncharacterized protein n=1 Tax=Portunus trituberculatus TaxID=210409 RepID=A0A5B7FYM2_PORTR|nr:hypothetical protein [Portunus trituberculatus]
MKLKRALQQEAKYSWCMHSPSPSEGRGIYNKQNWPLRQHTLAPAIAVQDLLSPRCYLPPVATQPAATLIQPNLGL